MSDPSHAALIAEAKEEWKEAMTGAESENRMNFEEYCEMMYE